MKKLSVAQFSPELTCHQEAWMVTVSVDGLIGPGELMNTNMNGVFVALFWKSGDGLSFLQAGVGPNELEDGSPGQEPQVNLRFHGDKLVFAATTVGEVIQLEVREPWADLHWTGVVQVDRATGKLVFNQSNQKGR